MSLNQFQQQQKLDDLNDNSTLFCYSDNKLDINSNSFINENFQQINRLNNNSHLHNNSNNKNNLKSISTDSSNIEDDEDNVIDGGIEEEEEDANDYDIIDAIDINYRHGQSSTDLQQKFPNEPKILANHIHKRLNKDHICYICNNKLNEPKLLSCLHNFCKSCLNEQLEKASASSLAQTSNSSLSPTDSLVSGNSNCAVSGSSYNDDQFTHRYFNNKVQSVGYISSASSTASSSNHSIASIVCPLCKQESKVRNIFLLFFLNKNYLLNNTEYSNQVPSNGIDGLEDDFVMLNMLDMLAIEEVKVNCTSCKDKEEAVARCIHCPGYLCSSCVKAHEFMRLFSDHTVSLEYFQKFSKINKSLFCLLLKRL